MDTGTFEGWHFAAMAMAVCLIAGGLHSVTSAAEAGVRGQSSGRVEAKNEDYLRFGLLHEGDAIRGKELFANEQKVACSRCHTVDGTAGKAGPDLFAIGDKFGRREIIGSKWRRRASGR